MRIDAVEAGAAGGPEQQGIQSAPKEDRQVRAVNKANQNKGDREGPGAAPGRGADPKLQEDFYQAASAGKASQLGTLVKQGARVDGQDEKGWTALMMAAWDGHASCVQLLLDAGASREIRQENGLTAAKIAEAIGEPKVLELIEAQSLAEAKARQIRGAQEQAARQAKSEPSRESHNGGYKGRHPREGYNGAGPARVGAGAPPRAPR